MKNMLNEERKTLEECSPEFQQWVFKAWIEKCDLLECYSNTLGWGKLPVNTVLNSDRIYRKCSTNFDWILAGSRIEYIVLLAPNLLAMCTSKPSLHLGELSVCDGDIYIRNVDTSKLRMKPFTIYSRGD